MSYVCLCLYVSILRSYGQRADVQEASYVQRADVQEASYGQRADVQEAARGSLLHVCVQE